MTSGRRRPPHRYELYQRAVQEPEADADFIEERFEERHERPPRRLREDFCGTAWLACHWVTRHADNRAWGIDLDAGPLEWGRQHNLGELDARERQRVELIHGDVLEARTPPVDAVAALNFSWLVFQTRGLLLRYLRAVRRALRPGGMLFLDLYGGPDAQRLLEETTELDDFDYIWDQEAFDPIHNRLTCTIHFETAGTRLERAFCYDWRLWTLPELREALRDAGFRETSVYWEGTDDDTGEGDGVFTRQESAENTDSWIAYVVATG